MAPNPVDLGPAATRLADLVRHVDDRQLAARTPCPDYCVGDLLDHIGGLATAFTWAATKQALEQPDVGPSGDAGRLGDDWRERIPEALDVLARAWRDPDAWTGSTKAGGIELPGEICGLVALDEIVVHGWDLAVATGQRFDVDEASLQAVAAFASSFSGAGTEDQRGDAFGPEVAVPAEAPLLERVLGMLGRDPRWSA
jgi:uncharacterized protein (TIGR03086 family)